MADQGDRRQPVDDENDEANQGGWLLGHPPQSGDILMNDKGQSVRCEVKENGQVTWRDVLTGAYAEAPRTRHAAAHPPKTPPRPEAAEPRPFGTRRDRSAQRRALKPTGDGGTDISSVHGAPSIGASWDMPTEQSFGTFSHTGSFDADHVSDTGPPTPTQVPEAPSGEAAEPLTDLENHESALSFADLAVHDFLPALLKDFEGDEKACNLIRSLHDFGCEEEQIRAQLGRLRAQAATAAAAKPPTPSIRRSERREGSEVETHSEMVAERGVPSTAAKPQETTDAAAKPVDGDALDDALGA